MMYFLVSTPPNTFTAVSPAFFRDVHEICDARIVVNFLCRCLRTREAAEQEEQYCRPKQYFLYGRSLDRRSTTIHALTSVAVNRCVDFAEHDRR